ISCGQFFECFRFLGQRNQNIAHGLSRHEKSFPYFDEITTFAGRTILKRRYAKSALELRHDIAGDWLRLRHLFSSDSVSRQTFNERVERCRRTTNPLFEASCSVANSSLDELTTADSATRAVWGWTAREVWVHLADVWLLVVGRKTT